jgi:hypothetical protein
MEAYFMMMDKEEKEQEETVYEGNLIPEKKKIEELDLFPILKDDLINKGPISSTIKKWIHEDKLERIKLQERRDHLRSESQKLADEKYKNKRDFLKTNFSDIAKLFEDKVTLKTSDGYAFNVYDGQIVETITFKKATEKQYHIELTYADKDVETIRENKKEFRIEDYINL